MGTHTVPAAPRMLAQLLALGLAVALLALPRPAAAVELETWQRLGLAGQRVPALAVSPFASDVIYAAVRTGDLLRSTDGGATWPLLRDFMYADPPAFAVDPTDQRVLYASNVNRAYKSSDGGAAWEELGLDYVEAFAVDPSNPQVVYAAPWLEGFAVSTTGGASWVKRTTLGDIVAFGVEPGGAALYAVTRELEATPRQPNGLYRTTDRGLSWTPLLTNTVLNTVAIDPSRPRTLYLGTEGEGVLKSEDGGATWAPANNGLNHRVVRALVIDPALPQLIYAGTWEGGVYRSVDGGARWEPINNGLATPYILTLALDPQRPEVLYAGTGDGVHRWVGPPHLGPDVSYVSVSDEAGRPVEGALVYRNGVALSDDLGRLRRTDALGNLPFAALQAGDTLVALSERHRRASPRGSHDGWAYRVLVSSARVDAGGELLTYRVVDPRGRQALVVRGDSPLVLLNLVVSVEWDADDAYLGEIARAMRRASDYLFDLSDGQVAVGAVRIADGRALWNDADIQIAATNILRPHAFVGGIVADDRAQVVRLGRQWDGLSGASGPWDAPSGYRTIAHELGHYALHLWDEYFGFERDQAGNLGPERRTTCTGPQNRNPAGDATNASAMDYQYTSSELSARGLTQLWSQGCEQTAQWQLNGESAWETVARVYGDSGPQPRWRIVTPAARGAVMAGPAGLPAGRLDLPLVTVDAGGAQPATRQLTVVGADDAPYRGAIVTLYRQSGAVIGQGLTDSAGRLAIVGAVDDDRLRVAPFDGGWSYETRVGPELALRVRLPAAGAALQAAGGIPHMRVVPLAASGEGASLLIALEGFGAGADPGVFLTTPGGASPAVQLSYSAARDSYEGRAPVAAGERGTGQLRALGAVGERLVRLHTTFRLQRVRNAEPAELFSDDGNLSLFLEPASLRGEAADLVVMPPGGLPGPLPPGLALVGDCYDIAATGGESALLRPGLLRLSYDGALVSGPPPEGLAIYGWDPAAGAWQPVAGQVDAERRAVSASVTRLGAYALLAPAGAVDDGGEQVWLPLVARPR